MHFDFGYSEEDKLGKPYDFKLFKRLYPFFRPYRLLLLISILFVIIITFLSLSIPYVTRIAIDRYILPVDASVKAKEYKAGGADASGVKIRKLRINITDSKINAIISKYKDLFEIEGSFAVIHFDDLSKLEKEDISLLRRYDIIGVSLVTALFLVIIFTDFVLSFLQNMLMEFAGQRIMHDLRVSLFVHIQNLPISFFNENPVGRLVTRVTNDVQNMHELFTSVITFVFKDLFLLTGIAVLVFIMDWKLALVSFTVLPFVIFASINFSRKSRDIFRILRTKLAEINTNLTETIGGIKVIQLFLQEKENYHNFKRLNHENYLAGMKQIRILAVFMPLIEVLGVVSVATVIFYGGGSVLTESISIGSLVAFISYVKMFFRPIRDIAEKYNIMQNAMASAERIFLILDTGKNEKISKAAAEIPLQNGNFRQYGSDFRGKITSIVFDRVSFGYDTGKSILKDISFAVSAGETVAVVGPTGAGKTTLINLIVRFYDPVSGHIFINGIDIEKIEVGALRSKIALVTQDSFLFSGSVRENIFSKQDLSEREIEYILRASNCKSFIDKLPDGVDSVLTEGGGSLSSGERQLISIARAFGRNPDLILLDEATSYIDSETEQKIQEALFKLMKDRTSIVVAHRLAAVRNADRIIVINHGRIIETGTHNELIKEKGPYFRLTQLQD